MLMFMTSTSQSFYTFFILIDMRYSKIKFSLIIPAVIAMLVVAIFPLIYAINTSITKYMLNRPDQRTFYALNNFKEVLTDPRIYSTMWTTIKFTALALSLELVLGFILASCLMKISKFRNIFVSILLIPMMISPIAVGLIWKLLLHPDLGIVNYLLNVIGIGGRPWLADSSTALLTIIFVEVWQWTPFVMILFYAGLLSLPQEPFEAATIDGASGIQRIRFLTLPFMTSLIVITATLRTIDLFKTYDLVFILTRGGPGSSTETFAFYIFYLGFVKLNLGQAAAASILFVILVGILTGFLFTRLRQVEV
ncbi:MAG: sugar ABC transporter permease [Anaerolineales bacterium]|nr:MAG: sugar ABC transporter permease [Anaerolineales bacterium]